MTARFASLLFVTALAACSGSPDRKADTAAAGAPSDAASVSAASSAPAVAQASARHEKVSDDLMEFDYAYPAGAAAIPSLKAWLDADIAEEKAELLEQATAARKEAQANGYPYRTYGYWVEWKTVTDLPGWLSLSAEVSTYEGGAHPNHGFTALVWDRKANEKRDPDDLFTSEEALSAVIRKDFCRELDKQRAKKRGGDGKLGGGISEFDTCIDPLDSTLILGSSNGKTFDRLGILVPPYAAGPYAEGGYEVTLPVTAAVLNTVKPQFRDAFAVSR
ncbi:MAG: DUF3298 and DUF4163 domain-containing protein [Novosphingobium sp.]|nr:DUF3298 and DUF4163 domain-containing protein [Novosphingobium sp.]